MNVTRWLAICAIVCYTMYACMYANVRDNRKKRCWKVEDQTLQRVLKGVGFNDQWMKEGTKKVAILSPSLAGAENGEEFEDGMTFVIYEGAEGEVRMQHKGDDDVYKKVAKRVLMEVAFVSGIPYASALQEVLDGVIQYVFGKEVWEKEERFPLLRLLRTKKEGAGERSRESLETLCKDWNIKVPEEDTLPKNVFPMTLPVWTDGGVQAKSFVFTCPRSFHYETWTQEGVQKGLDADFLADGAQRERGIEGRESAIQFLASIFGMLS